MNRIRATGRLLKADFDCAQRHVQFILSCARSFVHSVLFHRTKHWYYAARISLPRHKHDKLCTPNNGERLLAKFCGDPLLPCMKQENKGYPVKKGINSLCVFVCTYMCACDWVKKREGARVIEDGLSAVLFYLSNLKVYPLYQKFTVQRDTILPFLLKDRIKGVMVEWAAKNLYEAIFWIFRISISNCVKWQTEPKYVVIPSLCGQACTRFEY